jgi:hypothetical protein
MELEAGCIAYTICQVPVILQSSNKNCINLHRNDGRIQKLEGHVLESDDSRHIFQRDGKIHHLVIACAVHN